MSEIIKKINKADKIIIYGTKRKGQDAFIALRFLFPEKIVGFAVTSVIDQDNDLFMYPVLPIEKYGYLTKKNPLVIVATREAYHSEIVEKLKVNGFFNFCVYGAGNESQTALHLEVEKKEKMTFASLKNEYILSELFRISNCLLKDNEL